MGCSALRGGDERGSMADRWRIKSVEKSIADTDEPATRLRKDLTWRDLAVFGVAVVIGAGIFTVTASTTGDVTGPAVWISFVIAAATCALAALCYAEFASTLPVAGSAYTFSYATFGEFLAWIIGWNLLLELAVGAAVVAKGWSSYLGTVFEFSGGTVNFGSFQFDWGALSIVLAVAVLLALGTKLSSRFSAVITAIKVSVVILVVVVGAFYIKAANYSPFIPRPEARRRRTRDRPVGVVAVDRRAQQPLRLVRRFGGSIDRVLRVHRFRHRGHHGRGDQEPAARRPPRDLGVAGDRDGSLRRGLGCAVRDGFLHAAQDHARQRPGQPGHGIHGERGELGERGHLHRGVGRADHSGDGADARTVPGAVRDGARRAVAAPAGQDGSARHAGADHRAGRVDGGRDGVGVPDTKLEEMVNVGTLFAFALVSAGVIVLRRTRPDLRAGFRAPWVPLLPVASIVRLRLADGEPHRIDLGPVRRLVGGGSRDLRRLWARHSVQGRRDAGRTCRSGIGGLQNKALCLDIGRIVAYCLISTWHDSHGGLAYDHFGRTTRVGPLPSAGLAGQEAPSVADGTDRPDRVVRHAARSSGA